MFLGDCLLRKLLGCFFILIGVILLLSFTPYWFWLAILGMGLILLGLFLILKGRRF